MLSSGPYTDGNSYRAPITHPRSSSPAIPPRSTVTVNSSKNTPSGVDFEHDNSTPSSSKATPVTSLLIVSTTLGLIPFPVVHRPLSLPRQLSPLIMGTFPEARSGKMTAFSRQG
ncbi:hypothetical protein GGU11DRAFT_749971 [Lentinula aff. detonsa]|nr:hypothetical protein GGU11DRAFT_749971 [Lentinula aff. detonsa]